MIVTDNIRDFALDDLAEVGLLVQTADEFLIHQWRLDPSGVVEEIIAMAASTARPSLTARQVLQSLGRHVPEFAALVAASPELVGAAPE